MEAIDSLSNFKRVYRTLSEFVSQNIDLLSQNIETFSKRDNQFYWEWQKWPSVSVNKLISPKIPNILHSNLSFKRFVIKYFK